MKRKIEFIGEGMKWWDKINGNTYHSVRITKVSTSETIACPFQYGYGDSYRQTALVAMQKAKWIPTKREAYLFERENNYPIYWTCSEDIKRNVVAHGNIQ